MRASYVMVVIPFKGQIDLLYACLDSLVKSYVPSNLYYYGIILWDDGSTTDELNKIYSLKHREDIIVIKNDHVGYTRTVHKIMDVFKNDSRVDLLLIANSDIKFHIGTLYSLISVCISNPNIAAVGGKVIEYGGSRILHTGTRLVNGEIEDPYVGLDSLDRSTYNLERRLWVNGCCTLYNMHVMRKEGLNFDIDAFSPAYFEESDLMTKLNLLGYSVMYSPRAIIEHVQNATFSKEREDYERVFWANWEKYLQRWKPFFGSKQLQF